MRYRAHEVAQACQGRLLAGPADAWVTGVSTDSRRVRPGDAFVALRGQHADGHAFVAEAFARGASAATVSTWPLPGLNDGQGVTGAVIGVDDPLRALGRWAAAHRRRFRVPAVAVTGSVGKTTTKEMIAAVVERRFRVLKSPGNFNNELGVPLGMLAWNAAHGVAV
ncbi:MAG TPA: Mur ligase family protein, partial [Bacillota bacterium]